MSVNDRYEIYFSIPRPKLPTRWRSWLPTRGNVLFTLLVAVALVSTRQAWAHPALNAASAPGPSATTINYQGRLADSSGDPITQAGVAVSFTIFDAPSEGNPVWGPEMHSVDVSDGLFSAGLGSMTAGGVPTTVWNGDRYLEIRVGSETLSPRELIRSVPVAGMALTVPDGAIGAAQLADGAVSAAKLADGAVSSLNVALTHGEVYGSGAVLNLTTTPQNVPGFSFTVSPTTPQVLQVQATLDGAVNGNCGVLLANTFVDNIYTGSLITLGGSVRATMFLHRQVSLSPGSHTVDIRAWCESGSGGIIMTGQSSLSYLLFSQ